MESIDYYKYLKFCPECGKELEQNPINSNYSCFLHGDFQVRDRKIVWKYTENIVKRP